MSKKNKAKVAPAVGSPAAGSNNKRENSKQKKQVNQPKPTKQTAKPAKEKPEKKKAVKPEKVKAKKQISKKAVLISAIAVAVIAVIALVTAIVLSNPALPESVKNAEFKGRLEPDSVAARSSLSASQQAKLAKSVNAKGNTGAFDFYVNEQISVDEHTDPALIEFGSEESNDCILVAFLLDENGEVIYRSLGVEPGEEIRSVVLFDSVSYGSQTATLAVVGYDKKTYDKVGMQTVKIDLKIGVDTIEK
ncbi:MAG: hypothetical protein IJZ57_10620 [Clostridia bacterium]|nr:hypothetical protein [Clostridia bacterium]